MRAIATILLTLSGLALSSCSSIPTWMGGRESATVTIPGDTPDAGAKYTLCASSGSGPTVSGIYAIKQGEFGEAIEHFKAAVEQAPEDANARFLLGVLLEEQADFAGAKAAYKAAGNLSPCDTYFDAYRRVKDA